MTDAQIIEEMMKVDGYSIEEFTSNGVRWRFSRNGIGRNCYPDYFTDHNAVQRVIDGLGEGELRVYMRDLIDVTGGCWCPTNDCECHIQTLKATARQKCEAILKAKGVWEDD